MEDKVKQRIAKQQQETSMFLNELQGLLDEYHMVISHNGPSDIHFYLSPNHYEDDTDLDLETSKLSGHIITSYLLRK